MSRCAEKRINCFKINMKNQLHQIFRSSPVLVNRKVCVAPTISAPVAPIKLPTN